MNADAEVKSPPCRIFRLGISDITTSLCFAGATCLASETWRDGIVEASLSAAVWSTPDPILREPEARREAVGHFELCTSFRFGGAPHEFAESSMRLYAKEILPALKSWNSTLPVASATQ